MCVRVPWLFLRIYSHGHMHTLVEYAYVCVCNCSFSFAYQCILLSSLSRVTSSRIYACVYVYQSTTAIEPDQRTNWIEISEVPQSRTGGSKQELLINSKIRSIARSDSVAVWRFLSLLFRHRYDVTPWDSCCCCTCTCVHLEEDFCVQLINVGIPIDTPLEKYARCDERRRVRFRR